ncbi:metallophosphoesterase family protein [Salinisphaera sp. USBA-960]|nr:metallophosphoesterase family protein [Salifodinibacter halophilus]NNC26722.1 metallophosphoesterase family protein [Salifodinibacter halophilus]
MRIALIADTHGWLDPRIESALVDADYVVHAGDIGSNVSEALDALGVPTILVAGNADAASSQLALTARLDLPGGTLGVVHGHRWRAQNRHAMIRAEFADARAVVYGHSHRRTDDGQTWPWIINPGAAGKTRAYGGPSAALLTVEPSEWRLDWRIFEPRAKKR